MHPLFTIDDLVREICSYLSERDLSNVARVSSTWFHCSVSLLYKNQSLGIALLPLQKVTYQDLIKWKWNDNPIKEENFERFRIKYAPYVHTVVVDDMSISIALEATRMYDSKDMEYLFPNARAIGLFWSGNAAQCLEILKHLISPNIETLFLCHMLDPHFFQDVCQLAMTRISALHHLEIADFRRFSGAPTVSLLAESTQKILSFFAPTLTSVYIPYLFDTFLTESLPTMPNLLDLSIGGNFCLRTAKRTSGNRDDTTLHTFSYSGGPQFLYNTFWRKYDVTFLTFFHWEGATSNSDIGMVISKISIACPLLIDLSLGPACWSRWDRQSNAEKKAVPWSYIQPISLCKKLTHLSLDRMVVSVTAKDLFEFVKTRQTWVRLEIHTLEPLRLQDMPVYAEYCPNLKGLGITIDMDKDDVQPFLQGVLRRYLRGLDVPTFPALERINFAHSRITIAKSDDLVKFLYCVCEKVLGIIMVDHNAGSYIFSRLHNLYVEEGVLQTKNRVPSRVRNMIKAMESSMGSDFEEHSTD